MKPIVRSALSRQKGQTTTEYVMVLAVLAIAVLASTYAFCPAFVEGMDLLTGTLQTSLTDDGIRF